MTDYTRNIGLGAVRNWRMGRRLTIISSLTLILVAGASALFSLQGVNQQTRELLQSNAVRLEARDLTLVLIEAESAQRGYLLTLDQAFIAPYERAVNGIDQQVATLLDMTANDPVQNERIMGIVAEIVQKKTEMARTLDLASTSRETQAQSITQSGSGMRLMDGLRTTLDRFDAEEATRLNDRNISIDNWRRGLVIALLAALAGAVLLAYMLFFRTQQQVSALTRSQDTLLGQKEELEAHVAERTVELEEARLHADRERQRVETLLQDTNHRIGNSLATVSSLLGLQLMRSKSEEVKAALEAARGRVHAIASGHRRLRLGGDLETVQADDFLESVLDDLRTTQSGTSVVKFIGNFEPVAINARDATTIGIVLGELVTNAVKHAFPDGRDGTIWVRLLHGADGVPTLIVEDDGVGMPDDHENKDSGLGSLIVKQLARQFGGHPEYGERPGGGLRISLQLPELNGAPFKGLD